jgi:hypothetical protein
MEICDPTAPAPVLDTNSLKHTGTLEGQTVAFLDNGWSALGIIHAEFERTLTSAFGVARVIREPIPLATSAPTHQLRTIADEADYAVVALAN